MDARPVPVRVYPPGYGTTPLAANYRPWEADELFCSIWRRIRPNTLVDPARLYELWQLVAEIAGVPGSILEVGVWRGGSAALMARRLQEVGASRELILADTFAGVAKAGPRDPYYRGGEHADTGEDRVRALFEAEGLPEPHLIVGVFPDESAAAIADRTIAMCHIDVDVYRSARETFEWVWQRMPVGGVCVFDDYGFLGCEGVTACVDDLRARNDLVVVANANGHAVIVRTQGAPSA